MSKLVSSLPSRTRALLDRHLYNVNTQTFSVANAANVNGINYDKNIMLFGDSHAWGQGAPEWDLFTGGADFSSHSAGLYNRGFMARIADYVRRKIGFDERLYALNAPLGDSQRYLPSDVSHADYNSSGADFLNRPLQVLAGRALVDVKPWANVGSTAKGWYTPFATGDNDLISMYRDKLFVGRFNKGLVKLYREDENNFVEAGKAEYINLLPTPGVAASGAPWTAITDKAGTVLAEYDGAQFYIRFSAKCGFADLGFLAAAGQAYFVPGYGKFVLGVGTAMAGGAGYILRVYAADGVSYPAGLENYLYANMRIYRHEYINNAVLRADPQQPFRKVYIGVRKHPAGRKIAVGLRDASAGSTAWNPAGHLAGAAQYDNTPVWSWGRAGYPTIKLIGTDGSRVDATPYGGTVQADRVEIDTYAATEADVVYEIDFGSKVHCPVYVQDVGNGAGGASQYSGIRGLLFDNNQVTNFAMGGHTIGQWMGDSASYNDPARDHLADVLAYAKATPHLAVTELPIVNEYLRQTPLATFKANIVTFMSRVNGTLNSGGSKQTDFLFFTTIGTRQVEFEKAASSPITYDDYVNAAKEQIIASGAGLLDCRAVLKEMVAQGQIDHNRLYADDIHPSSAANELIAERVIEALGRIL